MWVKWKGILKQLDFFYFYFTAFIFLSINLKKIVEKPCLYIFILMGGNFKILFSFS